MYKLISRLYTVDTYYCICKIIYKRQFRCMLIVALGWSLMEAILKSKTEHIVKTDGALTHMSPLRICNWQNIHQNVHSQHWGPQYQLYNKLFEQWCQSWRDTVHWNDSFRQNYLSFGRSWKLAWKSPNAAPSTMLENKRKRRMIYFLWQVVDMREPSVTCGQKVKQHSSVAIPEIDIFYFSLTCLTLLKTKKLCDC